MDLDFPLILSWAVIVCGAIWGADHLLLRPGRLRAAEALPEQIPEEVVASTLAEPVLVEYARSFFPVLLLVLVLRSFLFEPYQIPSGSMRPTLEVGDYILVNKYAFGIRLPVFNTKIIDVGDPQRGDVMVFVPPHETKYFIKRVVGQGNDRISMAGRKLLINGEPVVVEFDQQWLVNRQNLKVQQYSATLGEHEHRLRYFSGSTNGHTYPTKLWKFCVGNAPPCAMVNSWDVGPNSYFMMGDNRDNSGDSRIWGDVPDSGVVGKAVAIWIHKDPGWHWPTFERNGAID